MELVFEKYLVRFVEKPLKMKRGIEDIAIPFV